VLVARGERPSTVPDGVDVIASLAELPALVAREHAGAPSRARPRGRP